MMFGVIRFYFNCLLISCWSKSAAAFLSTPSVQEASRGKAADIDRFKTHPRLTQTTNSRSSSSLLFGSEDTISAPSESNQYFDVLQNAIYLNSTEASSVLLSKITEMRQNSEYTREEQEGFLNTLLASGPDTRLPIWTIIRPLTKFSRRARMRSLRRTLDQITPDVDKKKTTVWRVSCNVDVVRWFPYLILYPPKI